MYEEIDEFTKEFLLFMFYGGVVIRHEVVNSFVIIPITLILIICIIALFVTL